MTGTVDERLLVIIMRRTAPTSAMAVFDHHGRMTFGNLSMANLLLYKTEKLKGLELAKLMPPPFSFLHHKWIKDLETKSAKPPPASCRTGTVQYLLTGTGSRVPARVRVAPKMADEHHSYIVRVSSQRP